MLNFLFGLFKRKEKPASKGKANKAKPANPNRAQFYTEDHGKKPFPKTHEEL